MGKELALAKSVPLADMTVPQLGDAFAMLDTIGSHHDNAHTICRLLQGLVLMEVKRKLPHGKYTDWLTARFPKSVRTGRNCFRAAEDFIVQLQRGKTAKRCRFEKGALDLLRQNLADTLQQLEKAKLDLEHPLVRAAAIYADGRSFSQIMLDLGPAVGSYDRSVAGKGKTGDTALPRRLQVVKLLIEPLNRVTDLWFNDGLWMELTRKELVAIDGDLAEMRVRIKKQLNK
jgi:hypothetical protein